MRAVLVATLADLRRQKDSRSTSPKEGGEIGASAAVKVDTTTSAAPLSSSKGSQRSRRVRQSLAEIPDDHGDQTSHSVLGFNPMQLPFHALALVVHLVPHPRPPFPEPHLPRPGAFPCHRPCLLCLEKIPFPRVPCRSLSHSLLSSINCPLPCDYVVVRPWIVFLCIATCSD